MGKSYFAYLKPLAMQHLFSKTLLALLPLLLSSALYGQGLYLGTYGAYALAHSPQNLPGINNFTAENSTVTFEQIDVSYAQGFNFGLIVGYYFNQYLSVEVDANYLIGSEFTARDEEDDAFFRSTTDYRTSANMLRIIPALVISPGFERLDPYARLGLVLGFAQIEYSQSDVFTDRQSNTTNRTTRSSEYSGSLALGLNGSLGLRYALNNRWSLFGELNLISMSYAPTRGELTEATENGIDVLPFLPTSEKELELVDELQEDFNNPRPDSEPSQALRQHFPFSSIGLNLGIVVHFGS